MSIRTAGLTVVSILLVLCGCAAQGLRQRPARPRQDYARNQLISLVSKNMEGLDRFRTKGGRLSGKMPTDKGKTQSYNLDGVVILYDSPRNFYLSGSYVGRQGLVVGSNKQNYWLGVMTDPSRFYWGYWKNANRECNTWRTGGPMVLLEAVGQVRLRPQPIDDEDSILVGPALDKREYGNVLVYMAADEAGGWYIAKEVYVSPQEPLVIEKIVYRDPSGSPEAIITYSDHRPMPNGGFLAYQVHISWPAEQSEMRLSLGKVTLVNELPATAFQMPEAGTFGQVEQVDAKCK